MIFITKYNKPIDPSGSRIGQILKACILNKDLLEEDFKDMVIDWSEEDTHETIFLERNISKPEAKEGEWILPKREKAKFKKINPKTNRMKKFKSTQWYKTTIPPEKRSFKNLPRYANKRSIVRFQDWLEFSNKDKKKSIGRGCDGKWYGWSHRAIAGFKIGTEIKKGDIFKKKNKTCPYKIKTEAEAKEHAIGFARAVS